MSLRNAHYWLLTRANFSIFKAAGSLHFPSAGTAGSEQEEFCSRGSLDQESLFLPLEKDTFILPLPVSERPAG